MDRALKGKQIDILNDKMQELKNRVLKMESGF